MNEKKNSRYDKNFDIKQIECLTKEKYGEREKSQYLFALFREGLQLPERLKEEYAYVD